MKHVDIVIVGGGVVGYSLAAGLLADTALQVMVVDAHDPAAASGGLDNRVIALAKRTVDEFTRIGVNWRNAARYPIRHIQVTDKGAAGLCELTASDYQLDAFGQVVSLAALGEVLQQHCDQPRCQQLTPETVASLTQRADGVTLTLGDGSTLDTSLLVLADGGRSGLAESVGIGREQDDYTQVAITFNVQTSEPHNHRAYERFTEHGPLAFLPYDADFSDKSRQGHGFSVVWTVSQSRAETLLGEGDVRFLAELQKAFGYRQGVISDVSTRLSYPLSLSTADALTAHRVVLLGNSAQTLHPIAGQGFNLGLRDVATLLHVINGAEDPGAHTVLQTYRQSRERDRQATITLTDTLVRTFSNRHFPLLAARNVGLMALNLWPLAQTEFVKLTTGYGTATPPLTNTGNR
ncbi:2-octaprenyl-6-methoxyphenyl hydroxylase [Alteromonas sp. ASW11-19]|uniref:2-octaprenyl-6-methoxyphenyl hydroxylase n=1 Tax=Alteromonas salexigens TaxID=2982530 RepID=A0ABT2VUN6_9ALTE|nr:2-octaprenyl-6-methoxyphenyl hydroxylase [Alteromonas salexigens]MCU7555569.1 2-octaprenyl-6-methoxyphenyl hydroxylase [Alteromonas salexigens]